MNVHYPKSSKKGDIGLPEVFYNVKLSDKLSDENAGSPRMVFKYSKSGLTACRLVELSRLHNDRH